MKKLFSLALGLALLASCSSDFDSFNEAGLTQNDAKMVELGKGFILTNAGSNATRTHWAITDGENGQVLRNAYLPYVTDGTGFLNEVLDENKPLAIGLCWVGEKAEQKVYTNYLFMHNGWLNLGEEKADLENCKDGALYNGVLYSQVEVSNGVEGELDPDNTDMGDNVDLNSGVYATENKSIFAGDYAVYYPYDSSFRKVGTITAKAPVSFGFLNTLEAKEIGDATFRYGHINDIVGGVKAAGFRFTNLTGIVQIQLTQDGSIEGKAKKVVLYSPSAKIAKEISLDASKIMEDAADVTIADSKAGAKSIVISGTAFDIPNYADPDKKLSYLHIAALPTTIEDLQVYVQREVSGNEKQWAVYDKSNFVVKAGGLVPLAIKATEDDFVIQNLIVDALTFQEACNETSKFQTLTLLDDITITGDVTIPERTVVQGGKIVVPAGKTLTVQGTVESLIEALGEECCVESPKVGGKVDVQQNGQISNIILKKSAMHKAIAAFEDSVNTNEPTLILATDRENSDPIKDGSQVYAEGGYIEVSTDKDAILNGTDIFLNEAAYMRIDGKLILRNNNVTNIGVIEVVGNVEYWNGDSSTLKDGEDNILNCGLFIHNIGAMVGTSVQGMTLAEDAAGHKGVYRCRVADQATLDMVWTYPGPSEIEMVNDNPVNYSLVKAQKNKTRDIFIDVIVSAAADGSSITDVPAIGSKFEHKTVEIGSLTVEKEAAFSINFSQKCSQADAAHHYTSDKLCNSLKINGNMLLKGDTEVESLVDLTVTGNLDVEATGGLTLTIDETINVNGNVTSAADIDLTNVVGTTVGGNFLMTAGTLAYPTGEKTLKITGDLELNGKTAEMTVAGDAEGITAKNFYMKNGAKATFEPRTSSNKTTMDIANILSVGYKCELDIKGSGATDYAMIYAPTIICKGTMPHGAPYNKK